ncbi:TPA: hypothetical protein I8Y95_001715 [Legionella pneumophila]|nr:hypothetical protein [Legionella pneumophila]HAT1761278.1 hypothetical protein [Legionella pneumophila]HAT1763294.1 hypothetical protein [Legionella pneumophila]HAT1766363.1 hypothetical protein [Legionella pneumophila]HAT1812204.1 hypothetical protein [Legionella pneumophila]
MSIDHLLCGFGIDLVAKASKSCSVICVIPNSVVNFINASLTVNNTLL